MNECTLLVRVVGPPVVTRAQPILAHPDLLPTAFPAHAYYTLSAVAAMFGRTSNCMRQYVWAHAHDLECAQYWQPRARGDWRYHRVLSEKDVLTLRALLFTFVKDIRRGPGRQPLKPR